METLMDEVTGSTEHGHTKILINSKEIELLKNQIQELKTLSDNPLAG
jgi:hypothetical protein